LTALDDDAEGDDAESSLEASDSELTAEQLQSYLEHLRPEDFGKFSP
jgi:hypothetical protein